MQVASILQRGQSLGKDLLLQLQDEREHVGPSLRRGLPTGALRGEKEAGEIGRRHGPHWLKEKGVEEDPESQEGSSWS